MKSFIISCNTIRTELDQAIQKTGFEGTAFYLESGLHSDPKKLNSVLQETLNRISNVDQVLLVMGYCGNAVLGLKPEGFTLILPKADDCITMLLGSMEKRKEVQQEKYTYFLSKGWLEHFDSVEKDTVNNLKRMELRYGKERAKRLYRELFKHYKRVGLIDTGMFDIDEMMPKAQEKAELLNLECETIPGTMNFLEKSLTGPWDENNFHLFKSGETILFQHLFGN